MLPVLSCLGLALQVASKLLAEMNRHKLPGRVTFLPLNKLKPKTHTYPTVGMQ